MLLGHEIAKYARPYCGNPLAYARAFLYRAFTFVERLRVSRGIRGRGGGHESTRNRFDGGIVQPAIRSINAYKRI